MISLDRALLLYQTLENTQFPAFAAVLTLGGERCMRRDGRERCFTFRWIHLRDEEVLEDIMNGGSRRLARLGGRTYIRSHRGRNRDQEVAPTEAGMHRREYPLIVEFA